MFEKSKLMLRQYQELPLGFETPDYQFRSAAKLNLRDLLVREIELHLPLMHRAPLQLLWQPTQGIPKRSGLR